MVRPRVWPLTKRRPATTPEAFGAPRSRPALRKWWFICLSEMRFDPILRSLLGASFGLLLAFFADPIGARLQGWSGASFPFSDVIRISVAVVLLAAAYTEVANG